jgi:hypothetical protein
LVSWIVWGRAAAVVLGPSDSCDDEVISWRRVLSPWWW